MKDESQNLVTPFCDARRQTLVLRRDPSTSTMKANSVLNASRLNSLFFPTTLKAVLEHTPNSWTHSAHVLWRRQTERLACKALGSFDTG